MLGIFLRKLVHAFYPLGFLFVFTGSLCAWACWKRKIKHAILFGSITIGLFLVGSSPLPEILIRSLEAPYYDTDHSALPVCDAIVLLGGGPSGSQGDLFKFNANSSFDRVITAIEMARQKKAPVLVIGGAQTSVANQLFTEGQLIKRLADEWKLSPIPIMTLKASLTTRDEATQTRELAEKHGWKRILLVTSAYHMRRSEAIFNDLGLQTVPVPCNFFSDKSRLRAYWSIRFPGSGGFLKMEIYLHEIIGWYAYKWSTPKPQQDRKE